MVVLKELIFFNSGGLTDLNRYAMVVLKELIFNSFYRYGGLERTDF